MNTFELKSGSTFVRKKDGKTETRHVYDTTLGVDVIFVSGRWSRFAHKQRATAVEWFEWVKDARCTQAVVE